MLTSSAAENGRGATLALVLNDPDHPARSDVDLVADLWAVLVAGMANIAEGTSPALLAENRAAAAARDQTHADLTRTHTTTLTAMLAALRTRRLSDTQARATAAEIAQASLLALHNRSAQQHQLAEEPVADAFAVFTRRIAHVTAHTNLGLDLVPPTGEVAVSLPQDVATTARAITEDLMNVALTRTDATRVRISWHIEPDLLQITVRDNGTEPHSDAIPGHDPSVLDRLRALGGRLDQDAAPGWDTTATAVLPLRSAAPSDSAALDSLHPRELEVLAGISAGLRNRDIATQLQLSEHTVKFHVRNVLDKLDVTTRGEAAAEARKRGLS